MTPIPSDSWLDCTNCDRRTFVAGLAGLVFCTGVVSALHAQQLEKSSLRLGVGNKSHLYYLPLSLAERRHHFKDYGLDVAIADFEGGGEALDALMGGSVDVVTGAYEHTLRMQAKGKDIRALIELGRFPGIVLAVRKGRTYNSPADLKGMKIGVTAPGSSSDFFVRYLMAKAGLNASNASFIPVITRLQRDDAIRIVADTRFPRVNYEIFGGTNPAAVLYAREDFIVANPNTVQALVNAFYKTLKWIATATTDEIVNSVPQEYFLGDRDIYVSALKSNLLVYSKTGVITTQGMKSAFNMLSAFDPELIGARFDVQRTFDDRFVKRATILFDDPNDAMLENDDRRPEIDLSVTQD